jgi:hypothetical protein
MPMTLIERPFQHSPTSGLGDGSKTVMDALDRMSMSCGFQGMFRATSSASFRRNPIGDEVAESAAACRLRCRIPALSNA